MFKRLIAAFAAALALAIVANLGSISAPKRAHALPMAAPFIASSSAACDANMSSVTLLLNLNGALIDASSNAATFTNHNGATFQSTPTPFFGTDSLNFVSASSQYLTATTTAMSLGSGAFFVEALVYPTATGSAGFTSLVRGESGAGQPFLGITNGALTFIWGESGVGAIVTATSSMPINTWSYVGVGRDGASNITLWMGPVGGTATVVGTGTDSSNWASTALSIGSDNGGASSFFQGNLGPVRVTTVNRHTASFAVPVVPFPTC